MRQARFVSDHLAGKQSFLITVDGMYLFHIFTMQKLAPSFGLSRTRWSMTEARMLEV